MHTQQTLSKYLLEKKLLCLLFLFSTLFLAVAAPLKSYIMQWIIDAPDKQAAILCLFQGIAIIFAQPHAGICQQNVLHQNGLQKLWTNIEADGWDLKRIMMIPQSPYIFSDTIHENFCLGESFSTEEIETAIDKAGLSDFVQAQPQACRLYY